MHKPGHEPPARREDVNVTQPRSIDLRTLATWRLLRIRHDNVIADLLPVGRGEVSGQEIVREGVALPKEDLAVALFRRRELARGDTAKCVVKEVDVTLAEVAQMA